MLKFVSAREGMHSRRLPSALAAIGARPQQVIVAAGKFACARPSLKRGCSSNGHFSQMFPVTDRRQHTVAHTTATSTRVANNVCCQAKAQRSSQWPTWCAFPPYQAARIFVAIIRPKAIQTFPPPNAAVSTLFCARAGLYQMQGRTFGGYSVLRRVIGG